MPFRQIHTGDRHHLSIRNVDPYLSPAPQYKNYPSACKVSVQLILRRPVESQGIERDSTLESRVMEVPVLRNGMTDHRFGWSICSTTVPHIWRSGGTTVALNGMSSLLEVSNCPLSF